MLTRRSMMLASIAAGVIMNNRTASAKAAQPATPVNFDVPAGACDCHTHIHPDPEKFPFFSGRVYTPELASPEEMTALHKALHMERVVIVTPSIYGTDNSATLFGMALGGWMSGAVFDLTGSYRWVGPFLDLQHLRTSGPGQDDRLHDPKSTRGFRAGTGAVGLTIRPVDGCGMCDWGSLRARPRWRRARSALWALPGRRPWPRSADQRAIATGWAAGSPQRYPGG